MLLLLHWINRRHYINRTWHWIDCRHRRGRRRPGEYLCYQQVSRHKCAMAIMMNKWWWRREKRLSIMEFKNGSELARASSLCRAQMILLPQLFLLACKLSPDDIAMHASASSCPAAILLGYLLLRIKPKLYFEFGIFEIWHFNLALLQVSNMWHSIWWWNLRRNLTLHSREKSYRYKQGDLKRRMFSTFSTWLRRFLCVCVSTCVCQMETKIGTQAGGVSSSAEYRRTIWKDEYISWHYLKRLKHNPPLKSQHMLETTRRPAVQSHSMEYRIKAWISSSVCSWIWIGHPSPFTSWRKRPLCWNGIHSPTLSIFSSLFTLYLIPMNTKYNAARTCVYSVYRQSLCSINTPKSSCRLSKRNLKLLWRLTVRNLTHKGIEEKIFWI